MSPVCVECGAQVKALYTTYSPSNICLNKCPKCHRFVDPYIEHDAVLLFIDLILHKPSVYRHLLLNRFRPVQVTSMRTVECAGDDSFMRPTSWGFCRLLVLLLFFEVYTKWGANEDRIAAFLGEYLLLWTVSLTEYAVYWLGIHLALPLFIRPSAASTGLVPFALLLSSFPKFLHILMVIWDYAHPPASAAAEDAFDYSRLISVAVVTSNGEALAAIFRVPYWRVYACIVVGLAGKVLLQRSISILFPHIPFTLL